MRDPEIPELNTNTSAEISGFTARFSLLVLQWRWISIIASLVAVAVFATGIRNLQFSNDTRAFFGDSNPEVIALRKLESSFATTNSIFIQVVPGGGDVFIPEFLSALAKFTKQAWEIPFALRASSITNFNDTKSEDDEIIIEPLLPEDQEITEALALKVRKVALASRDLVHNLISQKGDAAGISVVVAIPKGNTTAEQEIIDYIKTLTQNWSKLYPDMEVNTTGGVYAGTTFAEAARRDLLGLVPVAIGVALLLLIVGLGSVAAIVGTTFTMLFATLSGLGFAGHAGIALTPGTATSPLAIMVLVVASCVHIILNWRRRVQHGAEKQAAMYSALRENIAPVTVANVTTAIGFFCLQYSESPPLQEMGLLVAVGILFGLGLSLVFLPAICVTMPTGIIPWLRPSPEFLIALSDFVIARKTMLVAGFAAIFLISALGINRIGFEDNFVGYFDNSYKFRTDADAIEERLTGLSVVQFAFDSEAERGVFDSKFLRSIEKFAVWLESQPEVLRVNSITELFKRLNRSMNNDDEKHYRIADTKEENAQFMMFYELSLPAGQDLNGIMNVDRSKSQVTAILRKATSQDIRNIADRSDKWFADHSSEYQARATGYTLVFAKISKRNNLAMLIGMMIALVLVSGILIFALRDLRFGLLSLVPNLAPAIFAFGLWGYTFVNLNLGSSVVTTMTFGIVVDDTVHFLMGYLRNRKRDATSPAEAIKRTISTVGHALILTSTVIISGFLLMAASSFQINEHIGWLTTFVILVALICDLLLLPSLILMIKEKQT